MLEWMDETGHFLANKILNLGVLKLIVYESLPNITVILGDSDS